MRTLRLLKQCHTRAAAGNLWIFANEIESLASYAPGELVQVETSTGQFLGTGYVNPHSLIACRIISDRKVNPDTAFFTARFAECAALRDALYGEPFYRLVHSEGDYLPGLTIDRYGDVLSVQITTFGMENLKDAITAALKAVIPNAVIVLKCDSAARTLEGLPLHVTSLDPTFDGMVQFRENGISYRTNIIEGQKTGYYFDQRENRLALSSICKGKRVYDVFSYIGGWGLTALKHGAESVTFVDSSAPALEHAAESVRLNGFDEAKATCVEDDAVEFLRSVAHGETASPDILIVDPPAFIKSRKAFKEGEKGYINLNKWAFKAVKPGAFLFTFSCSHHMQRESFARVVAAAAKSAGKNYRILRELTQGFCHPVNPHMEESSYLKGYMLHILP